MKRENLLHVLVPPNELAQQGTSSAFLTPPNSWRGDVNVSIFSTALMCFRAKCAQMRMGTQSLIQVIQAFARHADDNSNDDEEDTHEEQPQEQNVMGEYMRITRIVRLAHDACSRHVLFPQHSPY